MASMSPHIRDNLWQENEALFGEEHCPQNSSGQDENLRELFPEIIFQSQTMFKLLKTVHKISHSQGAVLVLGESGTGKELIASAIHRLSPRAHKCFMAINCSAIPENLLEAELFGYEKGAFTGADRRRAGLFTTAHEGSVFLDEIGDMPLRLQAKLLRVLQEKKFTPVGGREAVHANIRIISATNIDLEKAVQAQSFRLDLYYRLNVLPIKVPPLRERCEDISLLLDHFVDQCNRSHPHTNSGWIDPEAKQVLARYPWPGNIRQLQNLVERLIIINNGGRLGAEHLPEEFRKGATVNRHTQAKIASGAPTHSSHHPGLAHGAINEMIQRKRPALSEGFLLNEYIEKLENDFILTALKATGNNKNQAARLLGLNRTTLVERIKKRKLQISEADS